MDNRWQRGPLYVICIGLRFSRSGRAVKGVRGGDPSLIGTKPRSSTTIETTHEKGATAHSPQVYMCFPLLLVPGSMSLKVTGKRGFAGTFVKKISFCPMNCSLAISLLRPGEKALLEKNPEERDHWKKGCSLLELSGT